MPRFEMIQYPRENLAVRQPSRRRLECFVNTLNTSGVIRKGAILLCKSRSGKNYRRLGEYRLQLKIVRNEQVHPLKDGGQAAGIDQVEHVIATEIEAFDLAGFTRAEQFSQAIIIARNQP
jgi:hypothetical protein